LIAQLSLGILCCAGAGFEARDHSSFNECFRKLLTVNRNEPHRENSYASKAKHTMPLKETEAKAKALEAAQQPHVTKIRRDARKELSVAGKMSSKPAKQLGAGTGVLFTRSTLPKYVFSRGCPSMIRHLAVVALLATCAALAQQKPRVFIEDQLKEIDASRASLQERPAVSRSYFNRERQAEKMSLSRCETPIRASQRP